MLPPDVNRGEPDFTVRDGKIVFGLIAIKGLGRGAAEEIVRAREEKGPFRDLFDFCERIDTKTVHQGGHRAAHQGRGVDAFAQPFAHRAQLLAALPGAIQAAEDMQKDRRRGQRSIFDLMEADGDGERRRAANETTPLPNVPRWSNTEQLKYEKEALDFYFSSHPLAEFDAALKRFASHTCAMVNDATSGTEVRFGGMISPMRFMNTKKGGPLRPLQGRGLHRPGRVRHVAERLATVHGRVRRRPHLPVRGRRRGRPAERREDDRPAPADDAGRRPGRN